MPLSRRLAVLFAASVLTACGGGDKASDAPAQTQAASTRPANDAEAVRFLQQATFGATPADIARVKEVGYENWISEQFGLTRNSHLEFLTRQVPLPIPPNTQNSSAPLYYSFWRQALSSSDQLRQRTAFTLSQIIVTSAAEAQLANDADDAHGLAAYLDILSEHAFGNYRDILQSVSTHPTMGVYLTSLGNRGDNGRTPDENYAREVMQLFTIGLFELNMDGTQKLVNGQPVETYDMDDIRNLAKVFTGWSWGNQGTPDPSNTRFGGGNADPMRRVIPMQFYPQYHSPDAKTFLSANIPAGTSGVESMRIALDTLFAHPNTAPFIAKQYIQRMVTSNPSPGYVQTVAQAFATGRFTSPNTNRTSVRQPRRPARGGGGDTAASGSALGRSHRRQRQAARADPAAVGDAACVRGDLADRQLADRRHRRHDVPDADEGADGVQLLPSRLRAAQHHDREQAGPGGAGVPDRARSVGGDLRQHDAELGAQRPRHGAGWQRSDRQ